MQDTTKTMTPVISRKKWPPSIRFTIKWWSFCHRFFSKWPKNDPRWPPKNDPPSFFLFCFFDFRLWISMVEWPPLAKFLDPHDKQISENSKNRNWQKFQNPELLIKIRHQVYKSIRLVKLITNLYLVWTLDWNFGSKIDKS